MPDARTRLSRVALVAGYAIPVAYVLRRAYESLVFGAGGPFVFTRELHIGYFHRAGASVFVGISVAWLADAAAELAPAVGPALVSTRTIVLAVGVCAVLAGCFP